MNVEQLSPSPKNKEAFRLSREAFIPNRAGCYVLTTFSGVVLYVGLAKNLRKRMRNHLDTPEKVNVTSAGKAILFYWYECADINKVERTWLNTHIEHTGCMPVLNKVFSPVSI
jgi:hypothetical protein